MLVLNTGEQECLSVAPRGTAKRIADELRQSIEHGDLPPGQMVPSERELVRRYGVARGTVRSALAVLLEEGLVEIVPGRGRRVVGDMPSSASTSAWLRIASDLLARLDSGEFAKEQSLPSESELVARYNVSRNTVRHAYRHLSETGAVVIRHGVGAFPAQR